MRLTSQFCYILALIFFISCNLSFAEGKNDPQPTSSNYLLSWTILGSGSITCQTSNGNSCESGDSHKGDSKVTLTATPADNYEFTSWTGCIPSSNTCSVTISENKTVSATFTEKQSEKATISLSATGLTNDTLDFGDVEAEQSKSTQVIMSSSSGISLENMNVTVSGNTFSNSCSSNVCTVTFKPIASGDVTGTLTITADNADTKTITLKGNGKATEQKSLTTTSEPNNGGSILCDGNACESSYDQNSSITLSAIANGGFTFKGFSGACSGESCALTFNEDKSVTATFEANTTTENPPDEPVNPPTTYTLTVTKPVNGTVMGGGIICGAENDTCSVSIEKNAYVILTVNPDKDFEVDYWDGCSSYSMNKMQCTVSNVASDITLSVSFKPKAEDTTNDNIPTTYKLTISPLSNGKLLCNSESCKSEYSKGTEITLKAEANEGFTFENFNGACSGNTCILTMDSDKTVGATFKQDEQDVTTEVTTVKLTINSLSNGKLLCNDAPCKSEYSKDTEITLTAEANEGFLLESWINDAISCVDTSNSCTLTMDDDKTIGVTFKKAVITENPSCDGELVNDVCISIPSGFSKKAALGFDQNGKEVTLTTQFYGRINGKSDNASVLSNGDSVKIEGLIVPDSKHKNQSADIIVVGLYTESDKLQADCDPVNGHFYMNTAGFKNKYCNWIVNGRPDDECNDRNLRDRPTTVNDFWTKWNQHMDSLKPMYTGVELNETGITQELYADTIGSYQGQVCLYFGYRLEGTLVFNSDPIIFTAQ